MNRRHPALTFRTAELGDVEAVVDLVESAYRGDSSRQGWTTEADLLDGQRTDADEVTGLILRPDSVVILAESGSRLVGCCHLERRSPDTAYFGLFAVDPAEQRSGVGRTVLTRARRTAGDWGCVALRMTVLRQREDLIAWYARRGFGPTGETEPFPYGDERFGRPREADLEFVVLVGPVEGR